MATLMTRWEGWAATLLVVVVLSVLGTLGWRMLDRIGAVEHRVERMEAMVDPATQRPSRAEFMRKLDELTTLVRRQCVGRAGGW